MNRQQEKNLRRLVKEVLSDANTLGLDGCRGIAVFDFDSTLAQTKEKVGIKLKGDKDFRYVSSSEYAQIDPDDLEDQDFTEFDTVSGADPILPTISMLRDALKCGARRAIILTARAPEAAGDIKQFLDSITDSNNDPILRLQRIDAVGSSDPKKKANAIRGYRRDFNPTVIHFYEDSLKNLNAVRDMVENSPDFSGVNVVLHHVARDGTIGFEEVKYSAPEPKSSENDFNIYEARSYVREVLTEALTQTDENRIATIARREAKKIFNDRFERKILATVRSELKEKATEDMIVKISKNVLTSLFKSLWVKRGFWQSDIKNSSN